MNGSVFIGPVYRDEGDPGGPGLKKCGFNLAIVRRVSGFEAFHFPIGRLETQGYYAVEPGIRESEVYAALPVLAMHTRRRDDGSTGIFRKSKRVGED